MSLIEELNRRMEIDGVAEVIAGNGGLPAVTVRAKNGTSGTVYLHGAHVAAWTPEGHAGGGGGEEVLWLSGKSLWLPDKAIRGGVPICFPWFGPKKDDPAAPAHGFARVRAWDLEFMKQTGDSVTVTLATRSDESTRKFWPADFILRHRVTFGAELEMSLELTNTGKDPLTAEQALHTYFSVGDINRVRVTGLAGVKYIDKTDAMKEKTQEGGGGDIAITAETDRVYLNTSSPTVIEDPAKGRKITISKENSLCTVVWNPWIAKAKAMSDFGDDEWPGMICVETCNVGPFAVRVEPGQTQTMVARIHVDHL